MMSPTFVAVPIVRLKGCFSPRQVQEVFQANVQHHADRREHPLVYHRHGSQTVTRALVQATDEQASLPRRRRGYA